MAIIRKQNEIDVYANIEDQFVTISETDGHYDQYNQAYEESFINIDVAHIDAVIAALQKCKAEILESREVQNG